MIPQAMLLKWVLPKVLDHIMKVFKLDKVLDYVEKENSADREIKKLKDEIDKLKVDKIHIETRIKVLEKLAE